MLLVDGAGLPLAVDVDSASPAEVGLIEPLLDQAVTEYLPKRLIYDRAADSDALRKSLATRLPLSQLRQTCLSLNRLEKVLKLGLGSC